MNWLLLIGAVWGLVSVLFGALADHAFALDMSQRHSLDTSIRYNMLYAVLIVVLSMVEGRALVRRAGQLFAAGSVVFSGGIYLALLTGIPYFTYATPAGGLTIMVGWGVLAYAGLRWKK